MITWSIGAGYDITRKVLRSSMVSTFGSYRVLVMGQFWCDLLKKSFAYVILRFPGCPPRSNLSIATALKGNERILRNSVASAVTDGTRAGTVHGNSFKLKRLGLIAYIYL